MVFCAVLILLMLPQVVASLNHPSMCVLDFPRLPSYYQEGDLIIGGVITLHMGRINNVPDFKIDPYKFDSLCLVINLMSYQNLLAFVFAIQEVNRDPELLPNVTLGFHLVDSCLCEDRAVTGMVDIISEGKDLVPNYQCSLSNKLVAIVDGISSKVSLLLARLYGMYRIPQVKYATMDPILSDKISFPTIYRTVPNEVVQYKAIVSLIKHFGWSWVGILVSDNESGLKIGQYLQGELSKDKSCVAFLERIPYFDFIDVTLRKIFQSLRNPSINAIILYGDREYILSIQVILYSFPIPRKVWIISSQWDITAGFDNTVLNFFPFNGSLALSMHSSPIPDFPNFILGLNSYMYTNDLFLSEEWLELFDCYLATNPINVIQCTGDGKMNNSSNPGIYKTLSPYSYSIHNAVYAVKHALHSMYLHEKMANEDLNGKNAWKLNNYFRNTHLKNAAGENLYFDKNGDISIGFDIFSWIVYANKSLDGIKVGRYDPQAISQELIINESIIRWNPNFKGIPKASCSEACAPGSRKSVRQGEMVCCYDCVTCPDGEISNETDMETCFKCPNDQWHNAGRNMCVYKAVTYLDFGESLGMSLTFVSFLLTLLSCFVLAVFIKKRDTSVVKANNRDLSFILLLSLKMCFLCSLIFIGHPSRVTCILRQTVFGVTFSISVSSILAKTVTVVIAFNAIKPGSSLRKFLRKKFSNSIVLSCSLIQVLICVSWLGISPPFSYYNMEDEVGKIVAECNEGSPLGFYSVLGYMGFLASVSFLIAFLARNLPDKFNEAKYITFSMLVFCSVWISFIPAYLSNKGKYVVAVEIFAILASSSGLLLCIFIPKLYVIVLKPEINKPVSDAQTTKDGMKNLKATPNQNKRILYQRNKLLIKKNMLHFLIPKESSVTGLVQT